PVLIPPRLWLLPPRAGRGDLFPGRLRRLRTARVANARPEADPRDGSGGVPLRVQRGGGGQDGGSQQPLPGTVRESIEGGLSTDRGGVGRVLEGRRQREVPHA